MSAKRRAEKSGSILNVLTKPVSKRTTRTVFAVWAAVIVSLVLIRMVAIVGVFTDNRLPAAVQRELHAERQFPATLAQATGQGISQRAFRSSLGELRPYAGPARTSEGKRYTHLYVHRQTSHVYYLRFENRGLTTWRRDRKRSP